MAHIRNQVGGTDLRPVVSGVPPETVVGRASALTSADSEPCKLLDESRRHAGFDARDARVTNRMTRHPDY